MSPEDVADASKCFARLTTETPLWRRSPEVHVSQTGDHLGRKGLGWGGGVGVLVGLAAPPLPHVCGYGSRPGYGARTCG